MTSNEKMIAEVERMVLTRIAAGRVEIPAMSAVAIQCLEMLREPDFHHQKLVAQFEREPMLAALVLRTANVAQHGGGNIKKLDQAVVRIGAQRLATVILEYASRQMFESKDPRIAEANGRIWEHSIAVAHLCRDLAASMGHRDGDLYYLAGLLHDIGKPVVSGMLLDAERRIAPDTVSWLDLAVWTRTVEAIHRKVGVETAKAWRLPDAITVGLRDCTDYDRDAPGAIPNIVRIANAIAKRAGYASGPLDQSDIDATIAAGASLLGADDDLVARLADGVKDRIACL